MFYDSEPSLKFHEESKEFQVLGHMLGVTNNGLPMPTRPFEKDQPRRHIKRGHGWLKTDPESLEKAKGMIDANYLAIEKQGDELYVAGFCAPHIRARIKFTIGRNQQTGDYEDAVEEITRNANEAWEDQVLKAQMRSVANEVCHGSGCTNTPEVSEMKEAGWLQA